MIIDNIIFKKYYFPTVTKYFFRLFIIYIYIFIKNKQEKSMSVTGNYGKMIVI